MGACGWKPGQCCRAGRWARLRRSPDDRQLERRQVPKIFLVVDLSRVHDNTSESPSLIKTLG